MKEAAGLLALLIAALGIGAMLLPGLTDMFRPHDPYRAAKPYSPWVKRVGLGIVAIGLATGIVLLRP